MTNAAFHNGNRAFVDEVVETGFRYGQDLDCSVRSVGARLACVVEHALAPTSDFSLRKTTSVREFGSTSRGTYVLDSLNYDLLAEIERGRTTIQSRWASKAYAPFKRH